jgi:hypothetical protein
MGGIVYRFHQYADLVHHCQVVARRDAYRLVYLLGGRSLSVMPSPSSLLEVTRRPSRFPRGFVVRRWTRGEPIWLGVVLIVLVGLLLLAPLHGATTECGVRKSCQTGYETLAGFRYNRPSQLTLSLVCPTFPTRLR